MKNNTMVEIGNFLKEGDYFVIFPHINGDADTIGSSVALYLSLKNMGKRAMIILEDQVAKNLQFLVEDIAAYSLDEPYTIKFLEEAGEKGYISICVDCASVDRFPKREALFWNGKTTISIDHHMTSESICDFNYIDSKASATGEILYNILKASDMPIDKKVGEAIFAAITTDTGNFQYSNTRKESHIIAAELFDLGVDFNKVSIEIYERNSLGALKLQGKVLDNIQLFNDDSCCLSFVSQKMLEETGANMDDSEGLVSKLRSIDGIEVSILLREHEDGKIKGSLRAKTTADVAKIAQDFGGGGHKKAAGFTLETSLEEALNLVKTAVVEGLALQ